MTTDDRFAHSWQVRAQAEHDRADRAEAELAALRAGIEALADEYAERSIDSEAQSERYPWGVAGDDLRALLAPVGVPSAPLTQVTGDVDAPQPGNDAQDGGEAWRDRHGDIWRLGVDGLMHTYETAPFSREHVEKKWGPLVLVEAGESRG